jgi:rhodanese-related sulfurtransferase
MADEYAGDVSVTEAWSILAQDPRSVLVDVRTAPEWRYVGLPDLTGLDKLTICVSWKVYPDMGLHPAFVEAVRGEGIAPDQTLLMICRSGLRSRDAAITLTARGFVCCYNVAGGFEGAHDEQRHRGTRDGWKVAGLPWKQE